MSTDQRVDEFRVRARKQILVAMREATQGYGFDEIVRDEFNEIDSRETRILFLCAAVATAELIDLSREQLLECAEEGPAEALVTVRRNLRGLLIEDEVGRVPARHPIIAQLIVNISGMLRWLERWALDVQQLRQELETLRTLGRQARFHHAYSRRIREIAELVEHKYLMTAVPEGSKPTPPGVN